MMNRAIVAIALLLPLTAHAQAPDVASQADTAALQGTRILGMLSGQIAQDQTQIKALQTQNVELQKQLEAAKAKDAPNK